MAIAKARVPQIVTKRVLGAVLVFAPAPARAVPVLHVQTLAITFV